VFVPAMYLLLMVPAAIAGFRWIDLVNSVYIAPFEAFSVLAVDAPNPWKIVGALQLVDYRTGLFVGTAAAGLAGLVISVGTLRLEPNARTVVPSPHCLALSCPISFRRCTRGTSLWRTS